LGKFEAFLPAETTFSAGSPSSPFKDELFTK